MGIIKYSHSSHMTKLAKKNKKNLVTQSNEISEAAYYLSLKAKRVLWMCFSQIKDTVTDEHIDISNGQFDVHVSDYQNLFSVSVQTASTDVKKGLEEILKSTVKFYPKEGEFEETVRPWLIEQSTRVGRGSYRVDFNPRLLPYIVGLTQQFTKFYLHECGTIKNSRTIRLYENLCQWRNTGIWTVTPQWLAERYQLPDSQKENAAEMKRSFIEPAINRINKETPLKVACSTTFQGSKVEKFVFSIVDET